METAGKIQTNKQTNNRRRGEAVGPDARRAVPLGSLHFLVGGATAAARRLVRLQGGVVSALARRASCTIKLGKTFFFLRINIDICQKCQ